MSIADEEIQFLKTKILKEEHEDFRLLTREEIIKINKKEPIWKKIRIISLILFIILWLSLLAAAITIVFLAPKCPKKPALQFYQKKVGYWVDVLAFADSDSDGLGDLKGLIEKTDYIKNLGADYVIIDSIQKGVTDEYLGFSRDLEEIDSKLGGAAEFRDFIRGMRRNGFEVVVSLNFNSVLKTPAFDPYLLKLPNKVSGKSMLGYDYSNEFYSPYGINGIADLDLTNNKTLEYVYNVTQHWLELGAAGILLKDVSLYVEDTSNMFTKPWLEEFPKCCINNPRNVDVLRRIRSAVDDFNRKNVLNKALFVDPGYTGYGVTNEKSVSDFNSFSTDPASVYLDNGLADMLVSRLMGKDDKFDERKVEIYNKIYKEADRSKLFLSTANPATSPNNDLRSLALSFLLPGSPIIYYSSELGHESLTCDQNLPKGFYPANLKKDASHLTAHLIMPWDLEYFNSTDVDKSQAYKEYLQTTKLVHTVEEAQSLGSQNIYYNMVKKLAKIRKVPALTFGHLEVIEDSSVFIRKAGQGHHDVIVIITEKPKTVSVGNYCNNGNYTPLLIHPQTTKIPENVSFNDKNVFVNSGPSSLSIYVFKCDTPALEKL